MTVLALGGVIVLALLAMLFLFLFAPSVREQESAAPSARVEAEVVARVEDAKAPDPKTPNVAPTESTAVAHTIPSVKPTTVNSAPTLAPEAVEALLSRPRAPVATGAVEVHVRWFADDHAVKNASVMLYPNDGRPEARQRRSARTSEDGIALFADVEVGEVGVDSFMRSSQAMGLVAPGQTLRLDVYVQKLCTVTGRVVDSNGRGVADAEVRFIGHTWTCGRRDELIASSDSEGNFQIDSGSPSIISFYARVRGHAPSNVERVEICDAGMRNEIELRVGDPDSSVALQVVDPDDQPIGNAFVRLDMDLSVAPGGTAIPAPNGVHDFASLGPIWNEVTDDDGQVVLAGLPSGKFRLQVRAPGFGAQVVELELGAAQRIERMVHVTRGAVIAGQVTDSDGRPVAGALVRAGGECGFGSVACTSFDDGWFCLTGVESGWPGWCQVEARADDSMRAAANLTITDGAITLWNPRLSLDGR